MFGRLGYDDVDTVDAEGKIRSSANPWALQFQEDMQALEAIDDVQSLPDRLHGCMGFVFTQYSRDFVAVDVSALRGTFAPNCIPTPGWVPPPVEVLDDDVDDVAYSFVGDGALADGRCDLILWVTCWVMFHLMLYCRFHMQQHRATGEPSGVRKRVATSSDKFLMKVMQLLTKLYLKNAMDVRDLQAATLLTIQMPKDPDFIANVIAANRNYNDGLLKVKSSKNQAPVGA
ncbi:hypothetical protein AK812_SmicGene2060 [Symbiodinium microadriaticum]|uniref:Uncharacterized protein n=1 Tax=Symbiodinium microadriaticum TaxID=2951 RepID=A0A1Q9F2K0_SYMMI|nr:hypothetical protein AK812_SmicGene2054 [Symbiodinium microadriaticum]OLQ13883.1 hypothetical protein AK812_SmicGene2058 [Symbiodinium microadriaticum]OLQ13907.1 hypothetical protein AK812_SmicGene2060 [Symbiodinium microadriaticum]